MGSLTAIAPWFGGKRSLAPEIVRELGPHKAYFEPFCGSCAVLFAKPVSALETVNDLHGELVNLAMVLASSRWTELYQAVDRFLIAQELVDAFTSEMAVPFDPPESPALVEDENVRRAAQYMAASWICRNGVAGTELVNYQMAVRWTANGGSPGIRWRSAVDSVPAWHDRLKGVVILRRDAFELIARIDDAPDTVLYVDPPYLATTRGGSAGRGGGSRYLHEFKESEEPLLGGVNDHQRLAGLLGRFKRARVVVSYYDDPEIRRLYSGWRIRSVARQKNLHAQNKRGTAKSEAPEILIVNGAAEEDGSDDPPITQRGTEKKDHDANQNPGIHAGRPPGVNAGAPVSV